MTPTVEGPIPHRNRSQSHDPAETGQVRTRARLTAPRSLQVGAINTQLLEAPELRVRAIDLHSSHPRIEQQDFLSLPHGGEYDAASGMTRSYDASAP